ncbi:Phr family secreted Rap phosphatase inhibitor [Bacillus thuringiensis]|uniref:Phr family secreted Rap phosphatase inhibitor n=1 Tax=Bacillus thuringiensis TaxID=1428 RepID=UPI001298D450|nr:Phr family secreted Rap phosphatase inhibitor [Bacillus cereus]MDA2497096.1 Phr family secreted Rap phosphatase inhibitor [Bacillus cereus]MRC31869.1 Phr family secreted Rap phosphatase inhibitor [Bacillus thuringiensis]HDR8041382.1 Phr family secreted Rap phosphatase inhibitor [Bacillus cereus]
MKKISLLLSGIAFIGVLTVGISQFSNTDQLATHGHYPAPSYSVNNYDGAPQQI